MKITFQKYHGAGNDFIIIDNRKKVLQRTWRRRLARMCHRHFGIGADGIILLEKCEQTDFRMIYFNADGREGSMCGNGGRCIIHFAHNLGLLQGNKCQFMAIDGIHEGYIDPKTGEISLKMQDVVQIVQNELGDFILDTGSPHYVRFVENVSEVDLIPTAHKIRYSPSYKEAGINVNFVSKTSYEEGINPDIPFLQMATYERGVEDETYACGTGAVAAALVASLYNPSLTNETMIGLKTKGGNLAVRFEKQVDNSFKNIWLTGGAQRVYKGITY